MNIFVRETSLEHNVTKAFWNAALTSQYFCIALHPGGQDEIAGAAGGEEAFAATRRR
jgi:hypothetical protein